MIKIEVEENKKYCELCSNRKPYKLYNVYFVNGSYSNMQCLCDDCLRELGNEIEDTSVFLPY